MHGILMHPPASNKNRKERVTPYRSLRNIIGFVMRQLLWNHGFVEGQPDMMKEPWWKALGDELNVQQLHASSRYFPKACSAFRCCSLLLLPRIHDFTAGVQIHRMLKSSVRKPCKVSKTWPLGRRTLSRLCSCPVCLLSCIPSSSAQHRHARCRGIIFSTAGQRAAAPLAAFQQ